MTTSGDEAPRLVVDVKERCARVTLDRPAKLNALDTRAYSELEATAGNGVGQRHAPTSLPTPAARRSRYPAGVRTMARARMP